MLKIFLEVKIKLISNILEYSLGFSVSIKKRNHKIDLTFWLIDILSFLFPDNML